MTPPREHGVAIYAQRFDASGAPQGGEFRVSPDTPGTDFQFDAAVAMDADGDFVVTWTQGPFGTDDWDIYARRFAADGSPVSDAFRVNTTAGEPRLDTAIAMSAAGGFVIAWGSAERAVAARVYDADGTPLGDEIVVGAGNLPGVAMDGDGEFVVTFTDYTQWPVRRIAARRYDAQGVPAGGSVAVSSAPGGNDAFPSIARDAGGDFVIAWSSGDHDGDSYGVFARRYSASGVALGDEFQVNSYTTRNQRLPSVGMDAAGEFVVAWQSDRQDGDGYGIYAQAYDAAGVRHGGEFRVNTITARNQEAPALAMDSNGDLVATWSSYRDGSIAAVSAQRYALRVIPAVTASRFLYETAPHKLTLTFNQNVSASLSLDDLVVRTLPGGQLVTPLGLTYDLTTNTATITFDGALPDGRYAATVLAAGITGTAGVPMAADHRTDFFVLRGDANHDGQVNLADFNVLAANFGQPDRTFSQGDFNFDGVVNLSDFNILAGRFGTSI